MSSIIGSPRGTPGWNDQPNWNTAGTLMPRMDLRGDAADGNFDDDRAMLGDIQKQADRIFADTQKVAQQSLAQVNASIAKMSATLMTGFGENKIDVQAEIGRFRTDVEGAIGQISLAASRNAEYHALQMESAARTGRMGQNQAAVLREASRAVGNILGQTLGLIGEMQLNAAAQATEFSLRGQQANQQLWSATMGQMANLVGLSAQATMEYAGLAAKTADAQARTMVNIAHIATDMTKTELGLAMDWKKTLKQIDASKDIEAMRTANQTNNLLMELGFRGAEAERDREFRGHQAEIERQFRAEQAEVERQAEADAQARAVATLDETLAKRLPAKGGDAAAATPKSGARGRDDTRGTGEISMPQGDFVYEDGKFVPKMGMPDPAADRNIYDRFH